MCFCVLFSMLYNFYSIIYLVPFLIFLILGITFFKKPLHVTVITPNSLLLIATQCPRVSLSHNYPLSSFTEGPASCLEGSVTAAITQQ